MNRFFRASALLLLCLFILSGCLAGSQEPSPETSPDSTNAVSGETKSLEQETPAPDAGKEYSEIFTLAEKLEAIRKRLPVIMNDRYSIAGHVYGYQDHVSAIEVLYALGDRLYQCGDMIFDLSVSSVLKVSFDEESPYLSFFGTHENVIGKIRSLQEKEKNRYKDQEDDYTMVANFSFLGGTAISDSIEYFRVEKAFDYLSLAVDVAGWTGVADSDIIELLDSLDLYFDAA